MFKITLFRINVAFSKRKVSNNLSITNCKIKYLIVFQISFQFLLLILLLFYCFFQTLIQFLNIMKKISEKMIGFTENRSKVNRSKKEICEFLINESQIKFN
jgi:hypothetical protein